MYSRNPGRSWVMEACSGIKEYARVKDYNMDRGIVAFDER